MENKQAVELLESAAKNLAEARKRVRGPQNDAGVQMALVAVGEIRQVVEGHERRLDRLERAWRGDERAVEGPKGG